MDRKKTYKAIVIIVVVTIVIAVALFYFYLRDDNDKYEGIPTLEPYINDKVGVLQESDYNDLQDFCTYIEYNNSCEIALLIVDNTGSYDLNTFAIRTFEKNGIGQEGKDNGVLVVFLVPEVGDIRWRTVTGDGVSDILSGFVLKGFENEYLIPAMEQGDLSWGITLYIYAIGLELDEKYISEGNDPWEEYPIWFIPLNGWQLAIFVVVFILLTIVTKGRVLLLIPYLFTRGGGRGGFGGGGTGGGGSRGRF
ncbi:MAG: TPM domain-containing protein [Methanomassiliicoccales archaeon]|nr:MAG: TPM domain-containing protein [Methanomassiliicoccales archaeon]